MWAFNKLTERNARQYFQYAVDVFLRWQMGDKWLDLFWTIDI